MTKLIIIDGMDNTGKSTLITRIQNILSKLSYRNIVIHSEKPPKNILSENTSEYQHNYYIDLMEKLTSLKRSSMYDFIILDRGWISEYVYGQMYRNRDGKEITEDNIILDLESMKVFGTTNVYLIMLYASSQFLKKNEDGNSLSNCSTDLLKKEETLFSNGYDHSLLQKKKFFEVDDGENFIEILPNIIKNILEIQ